METFPDSRFVGKGNEGISQDYYPDPHGKDSEPCVFVVHYRGHNYLVQYAPAFAVYTFLVLYIWFSVSRFHVLLPIVFALSLSALIFRLLTFTMLFFILPLAILVSTRLAFWPSLILLRCWLFKLICRFLKCAPILVFLARHLSLHK